MRKFSKKQFAVLAIAGACAVIAAAGGIFCHQVKTKADEALAMAQTVDKTEVKEVNNSRLKSRA